MKRVFLPLFCLLALTFMISACSDDSTAPESYEGLSGTVTDADGEPLADVAIGIRYDIPGMVQGGKTLLVRHPLEKPATRIAYDLPESTQVRVWITDYAGDPVVTLVDGLAPPGSHSVMWNGVDGDGHPAPSGMYYVHIEPEGEPAETTDLFLLYLDAADFLNAPNAVTDANGRFRIPDELIPVGEVIEATNELGEVIASSAVSDTLRVLAVVGGDPDPRWAQRGVIYRKAQENSGIEFVLP